MRLKAQIGIKYKCGVEESSVAFININIIILECKRSVVQSRKNTIGVKLRVGPRLFMNFLPARTQ